MANCLAASGSPSLADRRHPEPFLGALRVTRLAPQRTERARRQWFAALGCVRVSALALGDVSLLHRDEPEEHFAEPVAGLRQRRRPQLRPRQVAATNRL